MVELALALPLVLALFLLILWVGTTIHASISLETALHQALRLAVTRGVSKVVNTDVIVDINVWHGGGAAGRVPLLLTAGGEDWSSAAEQYYNDRINETFPGDTLQSVPTTYAYFYTYLIDALSQSLGSSLRSPCDPSTPSGAGCLSCDPLNPIDEESSADYLTRNPFTSTPIPDRTLGFICRYQPPLFILSPLARILALAAGPTNVPLIVLERKGYYDAE